jgi:hypothetical protein
MRYHFREENTAELIIDTALIPLMDLVATGKDAHWWDWEEIASRKVNKKIPALFLQTDFPQMRQYKKIPIVGHANIDGLRDLYITLRVLEEVAVIAPVNYRKAWSLIMERKCDKKRYYLSKFLHKGGVKCLLDGKKRFWGMDEEGKIIPVKLVKRCPRQEHQEILFV